jgi:mannose-6-phosphate isomerase
VIEIGRAHPGDPGLLAALLMNRVTCEPGDALYVPPGTIHAYLSGAGVEIMANSDNVLRGGLTSKTVAVDELLAVLETSAGRPHVVRPHPEGGGLDRYRTPAPEFCLWRISLAHTPTHLPHSDVGRIALLTDGRAEIIDDSGWHRLERGESVFLYPGEEVLAEGSGTLFVAGPGDHL